MHYGPESLKSEGMLVVEITENDRQQLAGLGRRERKMKGERGNGDWDRLGRVGFEFVCK